METAHRVHIGDSQSLTEIDTDAVDLVVTSPPYPMIEMWDELFCSLDPAIQEYLDAGQGREAFEAMHSTLDSVWESIERVLVDGGIACINIGDATRRLDGSFRRYQNHSRVVSAFDALGFEPLPSILWRKPTNSATKFMGSGMVPPNAYVTLEHEHILVFRNGLHKRDFEPNADRRYEAAYFWEERNRWFSDLWTDITGRSQQLTGGESRERSGAYPFVIPYRLICMYSVYGDTVLDPFWGTGTTTLAAMASGRHSIGKELDSGFQTAFDQHIESVPTITDEILGRRLRAHTEFVSGRRAAGEQVEYDAENYTFPVMTNQEREIMFYRIKAVERGENRYRVNHTPLGADWQTTIGFEPEETGV